MIPTPLLAAGSIFVQVLMPALASALIGGAIFALVRTVVNTVQVDEDDADLAWQFDVNRINELKRVDWFYRTFAPLVQLCARFNRATFRDSLPTMHREIQASGMPRFWLAEEYLGKLEIISLFLAPAYVYLCVQAFGMGTPGAILAVVLTGLTLWGLRHRLTTRARYRLTMIKRRMPFLLDLLTLLMEAGSTFLHALEQAVKEFGTHPVASEFGRVLVEINMGKSRTTALEAMMNRLHDDEITSIVGSVIQGEQLGTPLARIFRTQADVLRIKRTQRAETIAGEAGVKMLLPTVMIMASTVLIILGPFVLSFIYSEFM
jgi:tight adherence protein C